MDFWFSSVANITERNFVGLDLVVFLELELVSYCFELKPFLLHIMCGYQCNKEKTKNGTREVI